ncbi:MAG: carotenoid 1,2-hydratase [Wenzhouxiangella sp.]|nr:carotenoid 1,2-hydratase [Wenzhouxiangella sp.]
MKLDLAVLTLLAAALVSWLVGQTRPPQHAIGTIGLATVLGDAPEHFRRVTGPEPLVFPDDHGAHPDYRSEWWYFTGNLDDDQGQRMGFQFTLFRFALNQPQGARSAWASEGLWMAHLALSDGRSQSFFQAERFARDGLALAGATAERWWLRDWMVEATEDGWHLYADAGDFALDLHFRLSRALVLQGDAGYSRKGPEAGNASRYYSATRLASSGRVRVGDAWVSVSGLAWLDREWGSNQLSDTLSGWDWFALHLDDGRDLMVYRLRDHEGQASEWSAGALVDSDGTAQILRADDFVTEAIDWWRDPDGHRWPLSWRVQLPDHGLDLLVEPIFEDQLWTRAVRYWEGMMDVTDPASRAPLGRGYLELSGYAESSPSRH